MLHLPPDQVHLWHIDLSDPDGPDLHHAFVELLDTSERIQMARLVSMPRRREFAATRALCRTVLSRYVPAAAAHSWSFGRNAWGRPHAILPSNAPDIDFNITHSGGVIAMAVAHSRRSIGVDLEAIEAGRADTGIAQRFFAPEECAALEALPDADRVARFFELWSAKESYVKARGLGLSMPLDAFSVEVLPSSVHGSPQARLAVAPPDDDASLWRLMLSDYPPRHKLALCARVAAPDEGLALRHFEFTLLA